MQFRNATHWPSRALLMLVALALVAGACAAQPAPTQPPAAPPTEAPAPTEAPMAEAPEKVVIGFPASLSGRFEALGRQANDSLQMFVQWVNEEQGGIDVGGTKVPVEVIFADDKSEKDTAIRLFEKFVKEDGAQFMMGSYSSGLTLAQAPLAEQLGVLTFGWGAASDEIWDQGFTTLVGTITPATLYDESFLEFVASADPPAKTMALIYKDDPFTVSQADGSQAVAERLGIEIVFMDKYPPDAVDLTPILSQAWEAQPDIVIVESHFQDGSLAARQMYELGIDPKAAAFSSASPTASWAKELGEVAQYTYGTSQWEPTQETDPALMEQPNWIGPKMSPQEWAQWFNETNGYDPDYRAMMAFHSALVLKAAIEQAGSVETDAVRDALRTLEVRSPGGVYRIDPETLIQLGHKMSTIQWQEGQKVIIAPPETATGEAVYPAP